MPPPLNIAEVKGVDLLSRATFWAVLLMRISVRKE